MFFLPLLQKKFVTGVNQLVAQYLSEGRQKVIENYMIWRVVASFYPDQPSEEYHRRESCLKQTEDVFSPVVTAMYIRSKGTYSILIDSWLHLSKDRLSNG